MRIFMLCLFLVRATVSWANAIPSTLKSTISYPEEPRRFALLIGIDKYRSSKIPTLHGCKNDVMAMKSVLVGRYHFPEKNVHVLIDAQATYAKIIDEFKSYLMANATRQSDIVVIHFSGHGSRSPDPKDPSGFSETIVPYDSRDLRNLDITSKALSSILRGMARRTKNITVILDSCYSGRIVSTRGIPVTTAVRSIPASKSPAPEPPFPIERNRSISSDDPQLSPLDDSYVLLAAVLAKQEAKEYVAGSRQYGAFSYFLARELQRANSTATYRDLMEPVKIEVADSVEDETPQLVGPNQNHEVFGTHITDVSSYLLVMREADQGKVILPYAGEPHGITRGSTYDVYSQNVEKFEPPAKPIAQIQIVDVGPDSSVGKVISGGPIPDYSRAVLHELKLTDRKLRVWIQQNTESKVLQSIASVIKGFSQIDLTPERNLANILISEDKGVINLSTPDGTPLGPPRPSTDSAIDLEIGQQILKWTNWFYMLAVDNSTSGLDIELLVTPEGTPVGSRGPGSLPQIGKADNIFFTGDKAVVTITNKSARPLYVSLFVISSDRTITELLPDRAEQDTAVELEPGASISPRIAPRAFVPPCLSSTKDSFKVIATSNPVVLRQLEQTKGVCDDTAARSPSDLEDLSNIPNLITRGFNSDPGAWMAVRKVVEVHKKQ